LQASLDNVNVRIINLVFTILCALVVAIASKTVGALMVSSLMVIPYAASLQLSKSYRASIIISVIISLLSAVIGITLSYYLDIASGGAMVLTSVAILVVSLIMGTELYFAYVSLTDILLVLVPVVLGTGLILQSVFHKRKEAY
jgi:zinc transport system permease protein